MTKKSNRNLFKLIFVILSSSAFLGMMVVPLTGLFKNPAQESPATTNSANNASDTEKIQAIEKGYEAVLQREPNNPVALQGLAEARLKMNNLEGAIDPLEKLVKLYPEQEELKTLLTAIKQEVAKPNSPSQNSEAQPQK